MAAPFYHATCHHVTMVTYHPFALVTHVFSGLKYTHTDLKPENVLFINSEYESVYDKEAGITVRRIYNPAVKVREVIRTACPVLYILYTLNMILIIKYNVYNI